MSDRSGVRSAYLEVPQVVLFLYGARLVSIESPLVSVESSSEENLN